MNDYFATIKEKELGSISWAVNVARRLMREAAATKDRQLKRKNDRALRDLAITLSDKGYIIMTEQEILEHYGALVAVKFTIKDNKPKIWTIQRGSCPDRNGRFSLAIICVR